MSEFAYVRINEAFERKVRVMAIVEGWAMVQFMDEEDRTKDPAPFITRETYLRKLSNGHNPNIRNRQ